MLYPLVFQPIFKERVWGGRNLDRLFGKSLPPHRSIGESWEISDRPGDVSVVTNGPFAGRDLRWLMEHHCKEVLGPAPDEDGRFPLLAKILDAQKVLSLQVHPPPHRAAELKGEPKTEMWYVVDAQPGAALFAGLKNGTTRAEFESRLRDGTVEECIHKLSVEKGDSLFLPSGRLHALGAGNVIFEIQQNSDTTYRVFDWNRLGMDGKPRELHLAQSLASINFEDFEPALVKQAPAQQVPTQRRVLVKDKLFEAAIIRLESRQPFELDTGRMRIVAVVAGGGVVESESGNTEVVSGSFCLVPACLKRLRFLPGPSAELLVVEAGR